MDSEKILKVSIIIFAIFVIILGIINAISFSGATDNTCATISKAWAETMMVLNIVMIFIGTVIVVFVTYELFKKSGREDVSRKKSGGDEGSKKRTVSTESKQSTYVEEPSYQPVQTGGLRPSRIQTSSSLYDRDLAISNELIAQQAYIV